MDQALMYQALMYQALHQALMYQALWGVDRQQTNTRPLREGMFVILLLC